MPRKAMETLTESMFYVLMAFQDGPRCGVDVAELVERHTRGRVQLGPATLYTILNKFLEEGYLKELEAEGRKRVYVLEDKGRQAYERELARLRTCLADARRAGEGGMAHGAQTPDPAPALS